MVIVGQAGTGKSTALLGVARAHDEAGRQIVEESEEGEVVVSRAPKELER